MYVNTNLKKLITCRNKPFSKAIVHKWMFQVFMTIKYMRKIGYLDKDLKPNNLLISKNVIKMVDIGMAKEIVPNKPYTSNDTTLWY